MRFTRGGSHRTAGRCRVGHTATTPCGVSARTPEDDPLIGRPIEAKKLGQRAAENATEAAQRKLSPGLEPKTVVNTHRMLHRAWEDFAVWGWAKRNVVS